jgi:hypothetical protein
MQPAPAAAQQHLEQQQQHAEEEEEEEEEGGGVGWVPGPAREHVLYASLPQEASCTENLTPWLKLLPCRWVLIKQRQQQQQRQQRQQQRRQRRQQRPQSRCMAYLGMLIVSLLTAAVNRKRGIASKLKVA